MEGIENLNDVSQGKHRNVIPLRSFDPSIGLDVTYPSILLPDKEVEAHVELSRGMRRATRASFRASHEAVPALDTQPLDADAGADDIASDGNVDPYYEARVGNTARDVLERDLLPFVLGPYYIPYPYDEELYNDPKLITLGSMLNARYDQSLRNVERLSKQCAQQTQTIKRQSVDLKQQNESTVYANDEVSRKYRNDRDTLAMEKANIEEELVGTKSQLEHRERFLKSSEFNRAFAGVLNTTISVRVERGLRMGRTDEEFRGLSQWVVGFIPDAKDKFDRVVAAFS
ncbi:hypothetical protein Tco_0705815 [Tanacetum coccineum]|uniref:Uncharacterized protein n=1 Tax=Tanacetum coccineum TaxID=301880 RepID=A0ABQ4Y5N4_9ASTR